VSWEHLLVRSAELDTESVVDVGELPGMDRGRQRCECDHGDDSGYQPCGRKAKWRVTIDCVCGEGHPRQVEILCSRCLRTLRQSHGSEALTVRRL
jgi:hypothetical protein